MARSAAGFPFPSIKAGIREKNLEDEESGVADADDCLFFFIHVTNV